MPQTKIDSAKLADITQEVFGLSMDDRFTSEQRSKLLVIGKKLRGSLVNLITATFEANAPALIEANEKLDTVNSLIKDEIDRLDSMVTVVENLTTLVGALDMLLDSASGFF